MYYYESFLQKQQRIVSIKNRFYKSSILIFSGYCSLADKFYLFIILNDIEVVTIVSNHSVQKTFTDYDIYKRRIKNKTPK